MTARDVFLLIRVVQALISLSQVEKHCVSVLAFLARPHEHLRLHQ